MADPPVSAELVASVDLPCTCGAEGDRFLHCVCDLDIDMEFCEEAGQMLGAGSANDSVALSHPVVLPEVSLFDVLTGCTNEPAGALEGSTVLPIVSSSAVEVSHSSGPVVAEVEPPTTFAVVASPHLAAAVPCAPPAPSPVEALAPVAGTTRVVEPSNLRIATRSTLESRSLAQQEAILSAHPPPCYSCSCCCPLSDCPQGQKG